MVKAIAIFFTVIIALILIPVAIGIVGRVFGIAVGILGGIFGAVIGIIGSVFGAIFGVIGWVFDCLFGWDDYWEFRLFDMNFFTMTILVIIVALAIRSRRQHHSR